MNTLKKVLLYIWQLPQNLIGLLLILFYKITGGCYKYNNCGDVNYFRAALMPSGISLGKYVILKREYGPDSDSFKHEYGHTKQSKYLGLFYLLLIGLPSLCGNIYDNIAHANWPPKKSYEWYYNQPWEKWADELGGVDRQAWLNEVFG